MTTSHDPTVEERPLSPLQAFALALAATTVILAFYLYCLVILLVIAVLLLLDLAILVALLRFHLAVLIAPSIGALVRLAIRVLKSLVLKREPDFNLRLKREQAPKLFVRVEEIARETSTSPPSEICLFMDANAFVHLRGYGKGRGRTTLGLGFDLLTGLNTIEIDFVIAHEMAHARLVQVSATSCRGVKRSPKVFNP
jgi:Zn-dependent protease with chaperone function